MRLWIASGSFCNCQSNLCRRQKARKCFVRAGYIWTDFEIMTIFDKPSPSFQKKYLRKISSCKIFTYKDYENQIKVELSHCFFLLFVSYLWHFYINYHDMLICLVSIFNYDFLLSHVFFQMIYISTFENLYKNQIRRFWNQFRR